MEQKKAEKVPVLVIGYDRIKDSRQFRIAVLKSVNLNFVSKIYFVDKEGFTDQIVEFCKKFDVEYEKIVPVPAKLSKEQSEKLSQVKALVVFNNGEDKNVKRYETFAKKLQIYVNTWKLKDNNLVHK